MRWRSTYNDVVPLNDTNIQATQSLPTSQSGGKHAYRVSISPDVVWCRHLIPAVRLFLYVPATQLNENACSLEIGVVPICVAYVIFTSR